MGKPLRVLNIEDSERDSALIARHIKAAGYDLVLKRVETADEMKAALVAEEWDLILCDYSMPRFSALAALTVVRAPNIDVPFIIISGTVGEEIAVQALLSGANDYIPKGNLIRLVPAIEREVKEAENRRERRAAEEAQRRSEERYRALFEYAPDGIIISSPDDYYLDANASMCQMLGYEHKELIGMHASDIVIKSEAKELDHEFELVKLITDYKREWHFKRRDGSVFPAEVFATITPDGNLLAMIRDISERQQAAATLGELAREKEESLALIGTILSRAPIGFAFQDRELRYVRINETLAAINGLTVEQHLGRTLGEILPERATILEPIMRKVIDRSEPVVDFEISGETQAEPGQTKHWLLSFYPVRTEGGDVLGVGVLFSDVTERKKAEEKLRESESLLAASQRITHLGSWVMDLSEWEDGKRHSARWSDEHYRIFGFEPDEIEITEKVFFDSVHPDDRTRLANTVRESIDEKKPFDIEHRIILPDGQVRTVQATAEVVLDAKTGQPLKILGASQDITDRKRSDSALKASEASFKSLFDTANDAIMVLSDGVFIDCNHRTETMFGCTKEWIVGRSPMEVSPPIQSDGRVSSEKAPLYLTPAVQGIPQFFEWQHIRKDGTLFDAEVSLNKVDFHGAVHVQAIVRDVTDRKLTEKTIIENEAKFRDLFDNAPVAYHELDVNGCYTRINRTEELMLGYTNDELKGRHASDFIVEKISREAVKAKLAGKVENKAQERTFIRKDGTHISVLIEDRLIFEPDGVVSGIRTTLQDITDRKKAEALLVESREKLSLAAESVNLGIWDWNIVEDRLEWDDRMYELYGIKKQDFTGAYDAWQRGLHPEDRERGDANIQAALKGERAFNNEFRVVWPNGEIRYIEARALVERAGDGTPIRMIGVNWDISERKLVEIDLRELTERTEVRERMLTTMLSSMTDFAQIYDREGRLLFVNQPLLDLWATTLEDVIGKNFQDLEYPADLAEKLEAQIESVFRTKKPVTDQTPFTGADGNLGFYEYIFAPAIDSEGSVDFVVGSTRDITERMLAEERLRSSEETLAKSQEIAHLGSWELTIPKTGNANDGRLRWSDEVFRIFGYEPNEIEVSNDVFFNAVHPEDRQAIAVAMSKALSDGADYQIEHRILRPDGSERFVYEYSEIVPDPATGKPARMVGTIQDITSQKQLEEQFRQSQKMEAIGVLAGGIAHDFNNLLTAINGYSDLTLRKMAPEDPLRQNIEQVKNAGNRAADLTSQLLAFSRKQILQPVVHNLNTVVTNIEKMLRRIIRESVELRTVLDPDLGNITADPGQIEQVIMNLSINGRDAMPGGGTLTIETQNVYLDEQYVAHHSNVSPGNFVKMTVSDTGEGMSAETQKHIYDPFFTTKEVGKGTGLGLSTVYGIVKQSGGDIQVYSELGYGTTFKIYLPRVDKNVEKPKWTGNREERHLGTETILLVEDEELVRNLAREILSENGYRVLEAANGKAALSICGSYSETIHLLLSDIIMPKMSGGELENEVLKIRPEIKVLFMSGYTDDSVALRGGFNEEIEFIEKPFTPDELARKVREVLG